ncbi:MAG: Abi family protein, partial [Prevotellaceae bacterium]|nr:Abi family protein [Prevotellaceae bacterium]
MAQNNYSKRPFSLQEQINKLESKGLYFDNKEEAEQFLFDVSYYRLRAYTYPFQDNSEGGDHLFIRD